jgi:structural maintenance of chromosome 3 (chondroitin sulfate proteoglycan 6)
MKDLVRSLTEVNCIIQDLTDAAGDGEQRRQRLEQELDQVQARIAEVERELEEVEPEWRETVVAEREERKR